MENEEFKVLNQKLNLIINLLEQIEKAVKELKNEQPNHDAGNGYS